GDLVRSAACLDNRRKGRQDGSAEHGAIAEGAGGADNDKRENGHGGDKHGSRRGAARLPIGVIGRRSLVSVVLLVAFVSRIVGRERKHRQIVCLRRLRRLIVVTTLVAVAMEVLAGLFAEAVELTCRAGKEAAPGRLIEALVRVSLALIGLVLVGLVLVDLVLVSLVLTLVRTPLALVASLLITG